MGRPGTIQDNVPAVQVNMMGFIKGFRTILKSGLKSGLKSRLFAIAVVASCTCAPLQAQKAPSQVVIPLPPMGVVVME
jgi:hypothetical protein